MEINKLAKQHIDDKYNNLKVCGKIDMMSLNEIYRYLIFERYNDLKLSGKIEYDNKDLCKIFEYYTCILLTEEYGEQFLEYNDISPEYKELNKMSKNDTGIDVCNMIDTIVQCKLRKDSLQLGEITSFFACNMVRNNEDNQLIVPFQKMIIARNSDCKLSPNLKARSDLFIDKTYDKTEMIKYCEELLLNPPKIVKPKSDIVLRDYQVEAIELIKNNGNIVICLPTGTGKALIIVNCLDKNKKYLILVPLRLLMEQVKQEIIKHTDFTDKDIQFIGDNCKNFDNKKAITICVFNSINLVDKYDQFDKIFIDEAHHIRIPKIYQDDEYDNKEKGETYIEIIHNLSTYNNNVYLSATIDSIENFIFYKKDLREMIDRGCLTDYTINIPVFNNDPSHKNIANYLISNYRNIIVYTSTSKEGKLFNDALNVLQPNCSKFIDCRTSQKDRLDILTHYRKGVIPFLVNVKILTEGFDAPCTRGVMFLHMPSSKTMLIQIMGRCLRLHTLKTLANIILPYSIEDDIKSISTFLKTMACNDTRINKAYTDQIYGGYINIDKIDINTDNVIELRYEKIYNKIGESINIDPITQWKILFVDLKTHLDTKHKKPRPTDKDPYIYKLAMFLIHNIHHFDNKNKEIIDLWAEAVNDDRYHIFLITKEDKWKYYFNEVIKYEKKHGCLPPDTLPSGRWKNTQQWAANKNLEGLVVTDPELKKMWYDFTHSEKYSRYFDIEINWIYRMNTIREYINSFHKLPPSSSKDPIIASKGMWLNTQTTNYNYNKKSMLNPKLRKLWEEFLIYKKENNL